MAKSGKPFEFYALAPGLKHFLALTAAQLALAAVMSVILIAIFALDLILQKPFESQFRSILQLVEPVLQIAMAVAIVLAFKYLAKDWSVLDGVRIAVLLGFEILLLTMAAVFLLALIGISLETLGETPVGMLMSSAFSSITLYPLQWSIILCGLFALSRKTKGFAIAGAAIYFVGAILSNIASGFLTWWVFLGMPNFESVVALVGSLVLPSLKLDAMAAEAIRGSLFGLCIAALYPVVRRYSWGDGEAERVGAYAVAIGVAFFLIVVIATALRIESGFSPVNALFIGLYYALPFIISGVLLAGYVAVFGVKIKED